MKENMNVLHQPQHPSRDCSSGLGETALVRKALSDITIRCDSYRPSVPASGDGGLYHSKPCRM